MISIGLLLMSGCGGRATALEPRPTRPVATLFPTSARLSSPAGTPAPTNAAQADTGWMQGSSGIALRRLRASDGPSRPAIPLVVVRIDPAAVRLRVAYAPKNPRPLRKWFADEQPLAVINGGFFTEQYQSTALVISDGVASGTSYEGFGGMLAVMRDGTVSLRALRDQPYDPSESFAQALQSFPMLIFPGGQPAGIEDDGQRARRTAVALDHAGRLLLIVSPTSEFTLRGFAGWLSGSDLDVERALNFDGGSSTGLYLQADAVSEQIDSLGPLPNVLLVEPK